MDKDFNDLDWSKGHDSQVAQSIHGEFKILFPSLENDSFIVYYNNKLMVSDLITLENAVNWCNKEHKYILNKIIKTYVKCLEKEKMSM